MDLSKPPIIVSKTTSYTAGCYAHEPSDALEIRLVQGGSSRAKIDLGTGSHPMFTRPGDLLVSVPGRPRSFDIDRPRRLTLIAIDGTFAAACLRDSNGNGIDDLLPLLAGPLRDPMIAAISSRIATEAERSAAFEDAAATLIVLALYRAAVDWREASASADLSGEHLAQIIAYIDAHLEAPIAVAVLANELGLGVGTFARAFKRTTSIPVYQFVLQRRVDEAVRLLEKTSLPLAEIALRTGFSHQAHMTRTMSRLRGASPRRLRAARTNE